MRSQSAAVISRKGRGCWMPAQLARMSMAPRASRAPDTIVFTASSSLTSAITATAVRPSAVISRASERAISSLAT